MTRKQLIVMWVGIVTIVAMCLFLPWRYRRLNTSGYTITNVAGPYRLAVLGPPEVPFIEKENAGWIYDNRQDAYTNYNFKGHPYQQWRVEIDTPRLIISGIIFVVVFGGLMATFRDRKSPNGK